MWFTMSTVGLVDVSGDYMYVYGDTNNHNHRCILYNYYTIKEYVYGDLLVFVGFMFVLWYICMYDIHVSIVVQSLMGTKATNISLVGTNFFFGALRFECQALYSSFSQERRLQWRDLS